MCSYSQASLFTESRTHYLYNPWQLQEQTPVLGEFAYAQASGAYMSEEISFYSPFLFNRVFFVALALTELRGLPASASASASQVLWLKVWPTMALLLFSQTLYPLESHHNSHHHREWFLSQVSFTSSLMLVLFVNVHICFLQTGFSFIGQVDSLLAI